MVRLSSLLLSLNLMVLFTISACFTGEIKWMKLLLLECMKLSDCFHFKNVMLENVLAGKEIGYEVDYIKLQIIQLPILKQNITF